MIVDTRTGEITEPLTEHAARALTERIRARAESIADSVDRMVALIDEARTGQADAALGYASWTAYVEHEFADALPRLSRSQRQDVVAQLSAKGMSTRAIAPVVGVSHMQVARDQSPVTNVTPAPAYAPSGLDEFAPVEDVVDAEIVEDEPAPVVPITGRDGKTYQRPAPVAPRTDNRRAITDTFRDRTTDLLKIVRAITDLAADDRFGRNKEQVAARNRNDLLRAIDALSGVAEQLNN